jgi:hypothetical protein
MTGNRYGAEADGRPPGPTARSASAVSPPVALSYPCAGWVADGE